jgi:antitoxin component YwqK of YwqJK toxin-antitoxin module
LFPASIKEITFKGDIAYLTVTDQPFTGKLFDEKRRELGIFRRGLKDGVFTQYFNKGSKMNEGKFVAGSKEGVHNEWYENGKLKTRSNYSENELNGETSEYYPNGKPKITTNYLKGKRNGKYSEWHENGKLKKEIQYLDNKIADSKIVEYDNKGEAIIEYSCSSGKIDSQTSYMDNKRIDYFDYNAQTKKAEGTIKNNKKEGPWTEWYENGMKKFEGMYVEGERNGKGAEFDNKGIETWRGEYLNGKFNGKGVLLKNETKYEGEWNLGQKNGTFTETSMDGIRSNGQYFNDIKDGHWTVHFANGSKKLEAHYTKGEIVNGQYNEWYANGQKKEEKTLIDGKIEGGHTIWNDKGLVKQSVNYLNGKILDGKYSFKDDDGMLVKEERYEKGILISEYSYTGQFKNGPFTEYYGNGSKKMSGEYDYGKRKVERRYGFNRTMNQIAKGTGTVILIVFLAAIA